MNIGDRIRIVEGCSFYGPPSFMIGKEATVIELPPANALLPQTVVLLDTGAKWPCQEDEMELVPPGEQKEA